MRERRENVSGKQIDGAAIRSVRIDKLVGIGIELEDEEYRVSRNARDVFLEFETKLSKRDDVVDSRDIVESNDSRGGLEFGSDSLCKSLVDFVFVGGRKTISIGAGNDLHRRMFEFDFRAFGREKVSE